MHDALPPTDAGRIVLGSRSPRRLELLSQLVARERITVRPPLDAEEEGFEGLQTMGEITARLSQIVRAKNADVASQIADDITSKESSAILTADTVIVALNENNDPIVLGQPPEDDTWREVVREWFNRYLIRRPHAALTAVLITTPNGRELAEVTRTTVTFRPDSHWIEWYLDTEEPRGKAGGYALQGAGSLFVDLIHGSPSNVIGLPLRETGGMLRELQLM